LNKVSFTLTEYHISVNVH